jgi:glycosyltransferase involved in cell wall biosynthesis
MRPRAGGGAVELGVTERASVSVVIPAKNEALALPDLVSDLREQTHPPVEIVVADAGSTDGTAELALGLGCRVVPGGLPAEGRNRGASEAKGEWILFVDADVRIPPDAIERVLEGAREGRLDGLSTWFLPDGGGWTLRLSHALSAWYFRVSSRLGWPHSIGGFLFVRRSVHESIGGFDIGVIVAEDQDYVVRIARQGRYGFLRSPVVRISVRRFDEEGSWKMNLKWIRIELHRLLRGEIREDTFRYFKPAERGADE